VVSVVVPFFNDHAFMEDVFESLALQSLKQIEIIVVNDGSTQEATGEMEKLVAAQRDERIRVVSHSKNRGLSAARNTGVANAKTDCIFIYVSILPSPLFFYLLRLFQIGKWCSKTALV
jgi:glycosyltransferase involved in cell wall biosynthesis